MRSNRKFKILVGIAITIVMLFGFALIVSNDQILDAITPTSNRHSGGLRVYRAMETHVQRHGTSEVTLEELTNFDWEYVVLFGQATTRESISEIIGIEYTGRAGIDTAVIIFIKNNSIIYYETHSWTTQGFGDLRTPLLRVAFSSWRREKIQTQPEYRFFRPDSIFRVGYHEADGNRNSRRANSFHWIHDSGIGNEVIWD